MHICAADDSVDQARSEQAKSVKDFEAQSYNHFKNKILWYYSNSFPTHDFTNNSLHFSYSLYQNLLWKKNSVFIMNYE